MRFKHSFVPVLSISCKNHSMGYIWAKYYNSLVSGPAICHTRMLPEVSASGVRPERFCGPPNHLPSGMLLPLATAGIGRNLPSGPMCSLRPGYIKLLIRTIV